MPEDKKNLASLLLKKSAPEMEEVDESQDENIGKEASMEDFMRAIENKDSKAALAAFSSLMAQCSEE